MESARFDKLDPRGWNPRELPDPRPPRHSSDLHTSRQSRAGPGDGNSPLPAPRTFRPALPAWGCPQHCPGPAGRTRRGQAGGPGPGAAYLHGYFRGCIDGQGRGSGGRRPEVQHGIAAGEHGSGALGAALGLGLRVRLRVGATVGGERGDRRRHLGAEDDGTGRSWQLLKARDVPSPAEGAGWSCVLKLWLIKTENTL